MTFNGTCIPLAIVTTQANYVVLGGDVSQYAGQVGELRFTAPSYLPGLHSVRRFLLDYIRFSSTPLQEAAFTYVTNSGTITITGFTGPAGALTIPGTINGLPVISIGTAAFYQRNSLTSVTIPNSITSIGRDAFHSCISLMSVTIPDSITSIGNAAFEGCFSLANVNISDSVTNIADYAFEACYSLAGVTLPDSISSIGSYAFYYCASLTRITIPNSVTSIGNDAFGNCTDLTNLTLLDSVASIGVAAFGSCINLNNVTLGNGVTSIGEDAFAACYRLTSIAIPDSVTTIEDYVFENCTSLTNVTIPNSITTIGLAAFYNCIGLTSVMIPKSVTSIGHDAFSSCASLREFYFKGNAPSVPDSYVFSGDNNPTVYYLPGTTGWGPTFGGRPTALWIQVPTIQRPLQTQTAEARSAVDLWVQASSPLPLSYLWYLNATNLLSYSTNYELELTNVQFSQSGAYTVVVSNVLGAVTSAPAMLNVIPAVERRPVPGVKVTGEAGSILNVDYANFLSPAPDWTTLGCVSPTSTSLYCFDVTMPLPPQRFYRAWQTGTPSVVPSLNLNFVPAITLTGNVGNTLRLDCINAIGPTDAWVTLDTVTLTNTSQLFFDASAPGQPTRLYRIVPVP